MTEPVTGTCHCGMVHYTVPHKPKLLIDCNCSVCTKTGAIWAYYGPDDVIIMGETSGYARNDIPVATIEFHHCPKCGSTTHWATFSDVKLKKMGVNARLMDEAALDGVDVNKSDGRNWKR